MNQLVIFIFSGLIIGISFLVVIISICCIKSLPQNIDDIDDIDNNINIPLIIIDNSSDDDLLDF